MLIYDIETALTHLHPDAPPNDPAMRKAAVALILRERNPDRTDVLFIRRAEKPGDPWSGHMAFPGGHHDPSDASLLDTASREAYEEIGLDLAAAGRHLGALPHHEAMPRGRPTGMLIVPHVFEVTKETALRPNHEVAEIVWTPLAPIVSGEIHTTEDRIVAGTPTTFNGYRVNGGHFVWGLTYRILHSLFALVNPSWRAP